MTFGRKSVPYAGPIHWGWPRRNISPNTWVVDAARATEPQWLRAFVRDIDKALDKVEGA